MQYYDIHTHKEAVNQNYTAIISADLRKPFVPKDGLLYAVGIHPWFPDAGLMPSVREYAVQPFVAAIGETGLDRIKALSAEDFEFQKTLFEEHARLAEETGKPLIIHCVRAYDELLRIRRLIKPATAWIVHGFRGKEALALQLLNAGLLLSFTDVFNAASLRLAWQRGSMLAETDDTGKDIRLVYSILAAELGISEEEFSRGIGKICNSFHIFAPDFKLQ